MSTQNAIGDRGESIFTTRITQYNLFKVYFLGEKAPIVDFLLEILDEQHPYYFMVQVKSTELGYNKDGKLKAVVPNDKYVKLVERLVPTYVAGVDVSTETVYLCPAFDVGTKYTTIPVTHLLSLSQKKKSKASLNLLKQDVINYYKSSGLGQYKAQYKSLL